MKSVLVVGATGFVGSAVTAELRRRGADVRRAVRGPCAPIEGVRDFVVGDIRSDTDWSAATEGVDCVVHLAARVHVMRERSRDALAEYRAVNVAATENLARQAALANVRRFIFMSSIKVNGEVTEAGRPFVADDPAAPADPYAISKLEAEEILKRIAAQSTMEVVIVRPPLIYGPGVKANFLSLLKWVHKGLPLPFGAVTNRRSFIALDNLVDLVVTCMDHPSAANQVFLAADGEDLSTAELLRRLGDAMGKPARLLFVPPRLFSFACAVFGRRMLAQRLCGSLQVDITKTRVTLDWNPPVSVTHALARTVDHFLDTQSR